jgi:hypothetical protein
MVELEYIVLKGRPPEPRSEQETADAASDAGNTAGITRLTAAG